MTKEWGWKIIMLLPRIMRTFVLWMKNKAILNNFKIFVFVRSLLSYNSSTYCEISYGEELSVFELFPILRFFIYFWEFTKFSCWRNVQGWMWGIFFLKLGIFNIVTSNNQKTSWIIPYRYRKIAIYLYSVLQLSNTFNLRAGITRHTSWSGLTRVSWHTVHAIGLVIRPPFFLYFLGLGLFGFKTVGIQYHKKSS